MQELGYDSDIYNTFMCNKTLNVLAMPTVVKIISFN